MYSASEKTPDRIALSYNRHWRASQNVLGLLSRQTGTSQGFQSCSLDSQNKADPIQTYAVLQRHNTHAQINTHTKLSMPFHPPTSAWHTSSSELCSLPAAFCLHSVTTLCCQVTRRPKRRLFLVNSTALKILQPRQRSTFIPDAILI